MAVSDSVGGSEVDSEMGHTLHVWFYQSSQTVSGSYCHRDLSAWHATARKG